MNGWIAAVCGLGLAAVILAIACARLRSALRMKEDRSGELERLQQGVYAVRSENGLLRRELDALYADLEEEQARSDGFEAAFINQQALTRQARQQAAVAEARRIETEKDVYAGRMRIGLLEREIETMQREQLAQEALYQDILREREEIIARLQDQPKKRAKKRPEVLEQQITLSDLLGDI